jgi:hypothetical protein
MEIRRLTLSENWLSENIRSAVNSFERLSESMTEPKSESLTRQSRNFVDRPRDSSGSGEGSDRR